ncbi:MAG: hypothetical protein Tsb002_19760 [Wenzhouxiangellaceae bacterium]
MSSETERFGKITRYVYDALNRQVEVILPDDTPATDSDNPRTLSEYDAARRLTATVDANGNYSAHYVSDAVGNRTSSTIDGVTASYNYDANDRLTSNGSWQYEYDANGNTLREHAGADEKVYSYNRANRLIAATVTISGVSENKTFEYDNAGIRVSSRDNSNNLAECLVDRNRDYAQVIIEDAPSGITAYSYGDDLLSQNRGGTVNYYHYDGLGSTRALSDNNGALTDSYAYEAFGALLNQSGATSNDYLYTGEQYDSMLGAYYLRARYMNPKNSRFLSMDTFVGAQIEPQSLHKYMYVHANPVNNLDPSGNVTLAGQLTAINIHSTLVSLAQAYVFVCTAEFAISSVAAVANEAPTFGCRDRTHRGRIQAQGAGYEDSEHWAQTFPPSNTDGIQMLDKLVQRMPKRAFKARKIAINLARIWIMRLLGFGVGAPISQTFQNPGSTKGERIDIEVKKGSAFK